MTYPTYASRQEIQLDILDMDTGDSLTETDTVPDNNYLNPESAVLMDELLSCDND